MGMATEQSGSNRCRPASDGVRALFLLTLVALLAAACSGHADVRGAAPQQCIDAWNDPSNASNQTKSYWLDASDSATHVGMLNGACAVVVMPNGGSTSVSAGVAGSVVWEKRAGGWQRHFASRDLLPRDLRVVNGDQHRAGTVSARKGPFRTLASPVDRAPRGTLVALRHAVDAMCDQDALIRSRLTPPETTEEAESLTSSTESSRADLAAKLTQTVRGPARWQLPAAEFAGSFYMESIALSLRARMENALAEDPSDADWKRGVIKDATTNRADEQRTQHELATALGLTTCLRTLAAMSGAPNPATTPASPTPSPTTTTTQPVAPPFSNAGFPPRVQQLVDDWSSGRGFPARCLSISFSKVDAAWAVVMLNHKTAADSVCAPRVFDGMSIMKLEGGTWRSVIDGSDPGGYCAMRVPARILESFPSANGAICLLAITTPSFTSPTRNIRCHRDGDGVACGTLNNGRAVILHAKGKLERSAVTPTLTSVSGPVLAYDKWWTNGPITCKSAASGVSCWNIGGGSFTISASGVT